MKGTLIKDETHSQAEQSMGEPTTFEYRTAVDLVQKGKYEEAAELICDIQQTTEENGDTRLAALLAAVSEICLVGLRYRTDIDSHQHAYQDALEREQRLRQRLEALLKLLNQAALANEEGDEKKVKLSLSQRIIHWLARFRSPDDLEQPTGEPAEQPIKQPAVLAVQETEAGETEAAAEAPETPAREPAVVQAGSSEVRTIHRFRRPAADPTVPSLTVYCLGAFRLYQDNQFIDDWIGLKGQFIFKYMITHVEKPTPKEVLMDVFWPNADPEAARRNLHQAIYSLRQTLKQGDKQCAHIIYENECYALNSKLALWIDYQEFEAQVKLGRQFEGDNQIEEALAAYSTAEGLYTGKFLADSPYEGWAQPTRTHLHNLYLNTADRLSHHYLKLEAYTAVVTLCQKILQHDNCYEAAHRRLMRCYLKQGQRHLAVRQYQTCCHNLKEELDLIPSEKTESIYQQLLA